MPLLNEDRPERRTGFEEYIVHKELRLFSKLLIYSFCYLIFILFFECLFFLEKANSLKEDYIMRE